MRTGNFVSWLMCQHKRIGPIGDIASNVRKYSIFNRVGTSYERLRKWMMKRDTEIYLTLEKAHEEWKLIPVKYLCVICKKQISIEEFKQLDNCPFCGKRYCKECPYEKGKCKEEDCWPQKDAHWPHYK